jgi:hypothetical protein
MMLFDSFDGLSEAEQRILLSFKLGATKGP